MESLASRLRDRGLRNTPQRRAVLMALAATPHATAAQLAAALTEAGSADAARVGGLSRQGLYNVLEDLTRAGLVRCIEPAGSATRYEVRVGDNHHHLVCRRCGLIRDVDCAVGAAPCLDPGRTDGFTVDEAEVVWWGLCRECARAV